MSGPRIKVLKLVRDHMTWICSAYMPTGPSCQKGMGSGKTLAAAADAGRAHLAEHHAQGYCRLHGVHRSVCGCRVASVDPGSENGPQEPAQRCGYCGHPVDEHLGRWCRHVTGAIKADGRQRICCCEGADRDWPDDTGPIAHDNPLQTAHNESREGC